MPSDKEKKVAWKYAGYPKLCDFAASSNDCFAIRGFGSLNVRVLLKLQNNIVLLERELLRLDEFSKSLPDDQGGCGSFRLDEKNERAQVLDQIGDYLREYNVRLEAYLKIADRPKASIQQIQNLTNWLRNRPNAIEGPEQEFLSVEHDLLSVRPSRRTHLGSWLDKAGFWRIGSPKSSTKYHDKNMIKSLGGLALLVATLVLLLGHLWSLAFVENYFARLAVTSAFTIVFSFIMTIGTTVKPLHRSMATAGQVA